MNEVIETFITHKGNAENLLTEIKAIIEDHLAISPDALNWSHVGTLASVVEDLKLIAEKVGVDAEEAMDR